MRVHIDLYKLYEKQKEIKRNKAPYKVLNCGRRFGKTILLDNTAWEDVAFGKKVAYYGYSYKTLDDAWNMALEVLDPIIADKDHSMRQLRTTTGGYLDFWSSKDPRSGRGKKYHKVLGDEVAFWQHPEKSIFETIVPTLADYGGELILASTPYGTGNFFHEICSNPPKHFEVFKGTIYDNPYIKPEFIQILKDITDPEIWIQEFEAEFVDVGGQKFFFNYNPTKHDSEQIFQLQNNMETWISFDFNFDPCTATVYQIHQGKIRAIKEYSVKGGTYELCQVMKGDPELMAVNTIFWNVTGDSSGANRSATSGNVTNYDIILEEFGIPKRTLVDVSERNVAHSYSRSMCNQFLHMIPFEISANMKILKSDLSKARPTSVGKLYKNRADGHAMDMVDNFRYFVNAKFKDGIEALMDFVADNSAFIKPELLNIKSIVSEQKDIFERNKKGIYVASNPIPDLKR